MGDSTDSPGGSCLFLAALRSADLFALLFVMFSCVLVTFP